MQRFFLNPEQIQDGLVTFPDSISKQIRRVLRMDVKKDAVVVLDNLGWEYLVKLDGVKGNSVIGHVLSKQEGRQNPAVEITLCFSQARRDKVELILQKCTEIGVSSFLPYYSSRSLVQETPPNSARTERLESIMREAAEQSRRSNLPRLLAAVNFEEMLRQTSDRALKLIAWEGTPLVQQLGAQTLSALKTATDNSVALLIGPEGGFSAEEVELAENYGYQQFSLGQNILRMETACIAGSVLLIHLAATFKDQ